MNEKKQRTEKRGVVVMVTDLMICFCFFSLFLLIAFSILLESEKKEQNFKSFCQQIKGKHIKAAIITYCGFFIWQIYSMVFESDRDKKWEEQTQNIQKNTKSLKKELLETKTELLLTQNRLREEKEKGNENK